MTFHESRSVRESSTVQASSRPEARARVALRSIAATVATTRIGNRHARFASLNRLPIFWHQLWGIRERRHFDETHGENETTAATEASARALAAAGLSGADVDFVLCSCSSPVLGSAPRLPGRRMAPRLSMALQRNLGIKRGLDTQADCLGFLSNLELASGLIRNGRADNVLVCASEYTSAGADFVDRMSTLPGDGAAAAVVSRSFGEEDDLLASAFVSDAHHYQLAVAKLERNPGYSSIARGSKFWPFYRLAENGPAIMATFVPKGVPAVVRSAMSAAGLTGSDIDFYVFHQPSKIIVKAWSHALGVSKGKTAWTMDRFGVMSSASMPLTLFKSLEWGKFSGSGCLVLAGAATGWSFGAQVWRVSGLTGG